MGYRQLARIGAMHWMSVVLPPLLAMVLTAGDVNAPALPPPTAGANPNAAEPGLPELDRPTLICLGAAWPVKGDANHNAVVHCDYRATTETGWHKAYDFFRVDAVGLPKDQPKEWIPPAGTVVFAGSVVEFHPDTEYELKLTLVDPDGGGAEKILKTRTRPVPRAAADGRTFHVVPGEGGGSGAASDPYKGLQAADAAAQPGDIFLLHKGTYRGAWHLTKSGSPGRPIVYRAAGDGEALIDAEGKPGKVVGKAVLADDLTDLMFENLTVKGATSAIRFDGGSRITVRGCHIVDCPFGIDGSATFNGKAMVDNYIADNLIEGPSTWPRTKGIEDTEAIQVAGDGIVVCYNTCHGFGDALSTMHDTRCLAIDFYGNEISECTDDGIEMDYSVRNTRCFRNRLTNCFQAISEQPIYGGPTYVFRNALYNVELEPFKMHNSPSGALIFHNTVVRDGPALTLQTTDAVDHCVYRNNLFIGTKAAYAYECGPKMKRCDFDYDGFGGVFEQFLKWNDQRYEAIGKGAPVEEHAVMVDVPGCFASHVAPPADPRKQAEIKVNDLRLAAGSGAIDRGIAMPGFNDGFKGAAPDLGAYELDQPLPWYGVRSKPDMPEEMPTGASALVASTGGPAGTGASVPEKPVDKPKVYGPDREKVVAEIRALGMGFLGTLVKAHPDIQVSLELDGKPQEVHLTAATVEDGLKCKLFGATHKLEYKDVGCGTVAGLIEALADKDAPEAGPMYACIALLYTIDERSVEAAAALTKALELDPAQEASFKERAAKLR
ncbi:MAG TPA: right-handed parallel beta-helix repeat-containing protein [Planctomycetota bacterium]|nr:right-handed parallel beta-helix repeat-containing protein [Planctomycetota bacterium]